MIMTKRTLVVIFGIAALLALAAGFLLWKYKFAKNSSLSPTGPAISPVDVGKDITNKIVNPSLPQTNPFGARTNPFKNAYKNPFLK